jgi:hypothetical protein
VSCLARDVKEKFHDPGEFHAMMLTIPPRLRTHFEACLQHNTVPNMHRHRIQSGCAIIGISATSIISHMTSMQVCLTFSKNYRRSTKRRRNKCRPHTRLSCITSCLTPSLLDPLRLCHFINENSNCMRCSFFKEWDKARLHNY